MRNFFNLFSIKMFFVISTVFGMQEENLCRVGEGIHNACTFVERRETTEDKVAGLQSIQQTWTQNKNKFSEIQQQLIQGEIIYGIPLSVYDPLIREGGKNKIVLVKTPDERFLKAIFKPRAFQHRKAEQGAFKISQYLEMHLVPPTVEKFFEGIPGVISYYLDLENKDQQNPWKMTGGIKDVQQFVNPESLNNFYAFSMIFGMWDLKWVNTILVGDNPPYHLMSLDNESLISKVYLPENGHFFVCWKTDPTSRDSTGQSSCYNDLNDFAPSLLKEEDIPGIYETLKRFFIQDDSITKISNEEEKKQIILKRIKSFFWGKKELPHYIGEKGWWLQLYEGLEKIPFPQVTALNSFVISQLQCLDKDMLKAFFQDNDSEKQTFSDAHYDAIFSRCKKLVATLQKDHHDD